MAKGSLGGFVTCISSPDLSAFGEYSDILIKKHQQGPLVFTALTIRRIYRAVKYLYYLIYYLYEQKYIFSRDVQEKELA